MAINVTQDALWTASIDGVIAVEMRQSDGYCNATKMCQAGGKVFSAYSRNAGTKEFLQALGSDVQICTSDLVKTGTAQNHTWVHPRVAIDLAYWISPTFKLAVTDLVFKYYSSRAQPALPPPDIRAHNLVSSMALVGIDFHNPRIKADVQDYILNSIFGQRRAIKGSDQPQDEWKGVVEIAVDMGFANAVMDRQRCWLGKLVQERLRELPDNGTIDRINIRGSVQFTKERRFCTLTEKEIYIYKVNPEICDIVRECAVRIDRHETEKKEAAKANKARRPRRPRAPPTPATSTSASGSSEESYTSASD